MMVNDGITVDASRCYALFRRLSTKNQRKVAKAALREASNKIKKEAVKNLQGVIGHSVRKTSTYTRANGKTEKRSLARGIKVEVMNPETAKVHIMGDHRLKWFEMGTVIRAKKSGASTGAMTARPFFATAKAVASYKMKAEFERSIARYVDISQKK